MLIIVYLCRWLCSLAPYLVFYATGCVPFLPMAPRYLSTWLPHSLECQWYSTFCCQNVKQGRERYNKEGCGFYTRLCSKRRMMKPTDRAKRKIAIRMKQPPGTQPLPPSSPRGPEAELLNIEQITKINANAPIQNPITGAKLLFFLKLCRKCWK